MGKLKLFGSAVEGGLNAIKSAKRTTSEQKAAEKYAAGAQYADPLEPATMRMSEALGNAGAEGKNLNFTEVDRSRVFGSNRGGVGFSGLQHYSLPHKEANTVWGFGNDLTAKKKVKQNDPEKTVWTTFVGAPDQHKSNTVVLKDAVKQFQDAVKEGKVHPAQIKLMNDRIRMAKEEKTGSLLFDDAYDLTDPQALAGANTFSRRSAVGDVLLGTGVKGPMRRKAFKEEHGNQPWQDSGKMESILKRETDPDLVDANTFEVGNRLFVMDNGIIHRADLNEAFPSQVTGTDLGFKYQLTPKEKAMRDWMKQYEGRVDKKGRPAPPSYMDLSRNNPSQFVDEDYLTFLQKEGYKKGGAVHDFDSQEASERVKARIEKYRGGGEVTHHWDEPHNVERFHRKMEMHKATGGLTLKPPTLRMAGGGMLSKGIGKLGKRLMSDPTESAVTSARRGERTANEKGGNTIIKETGGNWLTGGVGSVERALQPLKRGEFVDVPQLQDPATAAVNKWVDSNLTNYVKKQMATPDDPVRKLAEEGVIHIPTNEVGVNRYRAGKVREVQGQPQLGKSDAAKAWEDSTDTLIYPAPAGEYTKPLTAQEIQQGKKSVVDEYPWLEKVAPETLINAAGFGIGKDLGFDHILDVLRADVAAGRIRPEQLNKVSMEQAVRRTHEFDQEMARKMAETQIKVTEGMPVKKEYPEGYKWIELTKPKITVDTPLPEGFRWLEPKNGYERLEGPSILDPQRTRTYLGDTKEQALEVAEGKSMLGSEQQKMLQDALKYEGDTMGHCVGSYCDDVLEGRTRIFSLRDAKGEPHVTIETRPTKGQSKYQTDWFAKQPEEVQDKITEQALAEHNLMAGNRTPEDDRFTWGQAFGNAIKQHMGEVPEEIIQIKGKGNAKPKEDYLPFVQDFVRGDNWSQVGDFKNTGFDWRTTGPQGIFAPEDVKALEAAGHKVPKYLTNAEKDDLASKLYEMQTGNNFDTGLPKTPSTPPAEGMANGGGILKYTTLRMGKGGMIGKGAKALAGAMKGEQLTSQAIGKAAESAGMKAPVTANKPLTTAQDFNTSLGDSIRQRMARDQELMDSFNYKYDKGQRVFTEDSAQKNWPPMTVLGRVLEGNRMMREDPKDILSKKIIDEATGKPKRSPHEPGYKVRLEHSPDNWSEFVIPESAIKGNVDMARGGGVLKYTTLRNRNTTQSQPNRFADGGKSEMKPTPRKKGYGVASDVLKGVHEFASKPFGYENPPVEFISELLGIPAASRVLDKLSYGEPITNAGKANVPLIPDDTFDAATALLGGLGTAAKAGKLARTAAKGLATGGSIIQHTTLRNRRANQRVR